MTKREWRVIGDSPLEFNLRTISRFDAEWVRTRARKNGSSNVRIQERANPDHDWEDMAEDEYERRAAEFEPFEDEKRASERLYPGRNKHV